MTARLKGKTIQTDTKRRQRDQQLFVVFWRVIALLLIPRARQSTHRNLGFVKLMK